MAIKLVSVGLGNLRMCSDIGGGCYADELVPRPSWHATVEDGSVIGELFKVAPGSYEYWVDGEMEHFLTFSEARTFITGEA